MARINIEDTLWADDRFLQLVESTGNRASAIGAVVLAFKTAQRFWIPDQRPIPSVQFRSIPFSSELLSAGLAEEVEGGDFIYVKGTREQFAWLLQRSHAGRENKGKKRERKRTGENGAKRKLNGREPLTLPPTLTLPHSPTLAHEEKKAPTWENPLTETSSRVAFANPRGCISEFQGDDWIEKLLSGVTAKLQTTWIGTYGETEWIRQELRKANAWIVANPKKAPKDFGRFMTNWLSQGWESHRKGIPSRRMTNSELNMQSIGELYQKVQAEK